MEYPLGDWKLQAPNGQYIQVLYDEPGAPLGLIEPKRYNPDDPSTIFTLTGVMDSPYLPELPLYGWYILMKCNRGYYVGSYKYYYSDYNYHRLQVKDDDLDWNKEPVLLNTFIELINVGECKIALGALNFIFDKPMYDSFQLRDCDDRSRLYGLSRDLNNFHDIISACDKFTLVGEGNPDLLVNLNLAMTHKIKNCRKCDFRNQDMSGLNLVGIDFFKANFKGANLTADTFWEANLTGANFEGADLTSANFSGMDLTGVNFEGANLTSTNFSKANLTGVDFTDAILKGTDFSNTDLTKATFSDSLAFPRDKDNLTKFINTKLNFSLLKKDWSCFDLTNANIIGLENIKDLIDLNAEHAILKNINLSQYNLSNANFNNADLTGAELSGAILKNASFECAKMTKSVLTGAFMESVNLYGASLGGLEKNIAANLSYAYLANAKLDETNLYGVNFSFATFYGANASCEKTSSMVLVDFSNAYLAGINLSNSKLNGAKFDGSCLVNVNLSCTDLTPANSGSISTSFAGACLQGAIFSNTKLNEVNLVNSAVSFNEGMIPVNHFDGYGHLVPPPQDSMPLNFTATTGLDFNSLIPNTICPNGHTLKINQEKGLSLKEMMSSENAPQRWSPSFRFELDNVELPDKTY